MLVIVFPTLSSDRGLSPSFGSTSIPPPVCLCPTSYVCSIVVCKMLCGDQKSRKPGVCPQGLTGGLARQSTRVGSWTETQLESEAWSAYAAACGQRVHRNVTFPFCVFVRFCTMRGSRSGEGCVVWEDHRIQSTQPGVESKLPAYAALGKCVNPREA